MREMTKANRKDKKYLPYLYMSPAMIFITVVAIYPIIYTLGMSFTNVNMNHWKDPSFIGFKNYIKILGRLDGDFFIVLLRTIVWTSVNMLTQIVLAIGLALLVNIKNLAGKRIYRTLLILPWAVPGYISTLIWKNMFSYDFGVINMILADGGLKPVDWLTSPISAFVACTIVNVWLAVPFLMIVTLGALQSIDESLYESATVDGATAVQKFKYITLPLLKPSVTPAVIITLFVTFKQFDVIYLMTKGLGGKTDVLITYAYNKGFTDFNYGYSAALSITIFILLMLITSFRKKILDGAEEVY